MASRALYPPSSGLNSETGSGISEEESATTAEEARQLTMEDSGNPPLDRITQLLIDTAESGGQKYLDAMKVPENTAESVEFPSRGQLVSEAAQSLPSISPSALTPSHMGVPLFQGRPRDVSIEGGAFMHRGVLKNAMGLRIKPNGELLDPNDRIELFQRMAGL